MESIKKYILLPVIDSIPLELIQADTGLKGFAVIVKLQQEIFKQRSYYLEATEEVISLFARRNGASESMVSEIITSAVKRGYYDKTLYDKYKILTNEFIQENYLEASKRQKSVDVIKEYLVGNAYKKYENVNILKKNVYISDENVNISAPNEKKRNEKKSKEEESTRHKYGEYANVLLTESELQTWKGECPAWSDYIDKLSSYMASTGKSYKSHLATLRNWYRKDKDKMPKEETKASYDLESFRNIGFTNTPKYKRTNNG